ncbi:TPA: hypothetical protein DIC20_01655 [Candidatus Dependentiae bacterium]|nr:MAG: hypothetical protein US03_C0008G0004 [candidate division TM6 bacterium GW2011_GWF2_36_131]KKQ02961.1 MAG: hypothetical protein US13_C0008G0034 [candidate division TM6 bacterium GW2011_GWE2_36_25]KKQ19670.1 MAG: hypothetical protein US32_C0006G0004 [candidate division TM6 bacterium GW2011_GWA2_36_9]HBR70932.1 hypothetical protein [Candidatus Dependentiae bacterium]HCU00391.1 hypothetical protein [Candidatus Dependentiae bacterium]
MKILASLTDTQRGIIYLVFGFLVLLDALNLLDKTIHYVILFAALGLIIYGFLLTKLATKIFKK